MDFRSSTNVEEPMIELVNRLQGLQGGSVETSRPQVLKPHKTRKTISQFEYSGIITKLAKYLAGIPDISKYVDQPYVNSVINPCELAFKLLDDGKFDAVIDRGYEKVNYSQLIINEKWRNSIKEYFLAQQKHLYEEVVVPFGLGA